MAQQCQNSKNVCCKHRLLKIRTDGSHARVHELGSIGFWGVYCFCVKCGPFVTKFDTTAQHEHFKRLSYAL